MDLNWLQCRSESLAFKVNPDPVPDSDPWFWWQKLQFIYLFINPRPPVKDVKAEEAFSSQKRTNIQHFKSKHERGGNILPFLPSSSWPKSVRIRIRIRIHSTADKKIIWRKSGIHSKCNHLKHFWECWITVKTHKNLNPSGKIRPFKEYHAVDSEICIHYALPKRGI